MPANPNKGYQADELFAWVYSQVERLLDLPPGSKIDPDKSLVMLGLDSIDGMQISTAMREEFKIYLYESIFWDYPTINSLTEMLVEKTK